MLNSYCCPGCKDLLFETEKYYIYKNTSCKLFHCTISKNPIREKEKIINCKACNYQIGYLSKDKLFEMCNCSNCGRTKEDLIRLQSDYENICQAGFEGDIEDYINYVNNYEEGNKVRKSYE